MKGKTMKQFMILYFSILALACSGITKVELFPADYQGKSFSFIEDYPLVLVLKLAGDGASIAKKVPVPVIELPQELKLIEVATRSGKMTSIPFTQEDFSHNGKLFSRYRIMIPGHLLKKLTPEDFGWRAGFNFFIEAAEKSAGKNADFQIYIEENGIKHFERRYKGAILPRLHRPSHPLTRFTGGVTFLSSAGLEENFILKKTGNFWRSLSEKPFYSVSWENFSYPEKTNTFLDANFRTVAKACATRSSTLKFPGTNFRDLGFMVNGKVTRKGVPLFVDGKGNIDPSSICPQYLLKDPEGLFWGEYFRRGYHEKLKRSPNCRIIWLDYEPFVTGGTCDNCRTDFAKFAGLKKVPERTELVDGQPLNRKWRDYKITQHRKILEKFVETALREFPGYEIHLCCATPADDFRNSWDAVDSSSVMKKVAAFTPMNYNTGLVYYNSVASQEKRFGALKNYSWVDPSEEIQRFFIRYSPEKIVQNIIATAALGADGFVIYPTDVLDGRMLHGIARAFSAIGKVEDILFSKECTAKLNLKPRNVITIELENEKNEKKKVVLPDIQSALRAHLHEKNGIYTLTLLNYSSHDIILEVSLHNFTGKGEINIHDVLNKEYYSGITSEKIRTGFLIHLPVDGARLLRIGGITPTVGKEINQNTMKTMLEKAQKELDGKMIFQAQKSGEAELKWRITKKRLTMELRHGEQFLLIDPASGEVVSWKNGTKTPVGGKSPMFGGLRFFDLRNQNTQNYAISDVDLKPDYAEVSLTHTIPADKGFGEENPLEGLKIIKSFRLCKGTKRTGKVAMTVEFFNPTKTAKQFGFRFFNMPLSAWKTPEQAFQFQLDGKAALTGTFYVQPEKKINWHAVVNSKSYAGKLEGKLAARWYDYTFSAPEAAGFYSWTDGTNITAEPLFEDVMLAPGEKRVFTQTFTFKQK